MRFVSSPSLATALRLCVVALLFAQVVPAQLDCRCGGSSPMDCCRAPEEQTIASASMCCSAGGDLQSLRATGCSRGESVGVVRDANLAPSVELGKPQLDHVVFVVDQAAETSRPGDAGFASTAHGPPGATPRTIYLFCESLLI